MQKYLNFKMIMFLSLVTAIAVVTYLKLDTLAKTSYIVLENILNPSEPASETLSSEELSGTSQVGPPSNKIKVADNNAGLDQHKIVVSREGKSKEFWVQGVIWRAYNDIGGVKSILGVPTSNEYSWQGGIRQDFERGHWLFWSSSTGVKIDYTPEGILSADSPKLQVPIFVNGRPAVQWSRLSKKNYFITQDFGENGHFGQDLALSGNPNPGYEVHPITKGKVIFAGWTGSNSYGYCVLIQHTQNNGRYYYSQYSHLYETPNVSPGQQVNKNVVLGRVGNTGKSTGPHLDFQIKEIPSLDKKKLAEVSLSDLGYGYAPGHRSFEGNIYYDPRTGQTYYKPSYIITNYSTNPGALMNEFHRLFELTLPLKSVLPKSW